MKIFIKIILCVLLINTQAIAAKKHLPNSGDAELDMALQLIHKNRKRK